VACTVGSGLYGRAGLSSGSADRSSHQPLARVIIRSHKRVPSFSIHVYAYIYIFIYVYAYTSVKMYIYVYICMYICMCICMHLSAHHD